MMRSREFHDRHHAFQYLVGCAIAELILRDPALIAEAKASLLRSAGDDPQRAHMRSLWDSLLARTPQEVAFELSRDDEHGDIVRQTRPPFVALPAPQRADLLAQARRLVEAR